MVTFKNASYLTYLILGKIRVNIQTAENGAVTMRTESGLNNSIIHSSSSSSMEAEASNVALEDVLVVETNNESDRRPLQQMTFRLRNKKVEAEQVTNNLWAV